MDFKNWITVEQRVNNLLCTLIDHRVNICDLAAKLNVNESFVNWFRNSTIGKTLGLGTEEQPAATPPKKQIKNYSSTPEQRLQHLEDFYNKLLMQWNPHSKGGIDCGKGFDGKVWCKAPWKFINPRHETPGNPRTSGYLPQDELVKQWEQIVQRTKTDIKSLYKELGMTGGKEEVPTSSAAASTEVNNVKSGIEKAKEALGVLRSILTDSKHQELLNHLEQEVSKMGKPSHYHQMSSGEQAWYDRLGNDERQKFDDEMGRSGNQNIDHGSEWWHTAANRAGKAAQQGYQDADANWKWAAGYANRQRIRRDMNPEWEKSLQGEALTTGGKLFREWLKKRVEENANATSGVQADTPSDVMAPTDPKEIARRKAVSNFTATMMKKNPKLKPGGTDQNTVANLTATDPMLSKADPTTQQAVNAFFLKK